TRGRPGGSPNSASARSSPSPIRPRRCAENWSRFSMPRLSRLWGLAVLAWPLAAGAQTPDMAAVMERLDRLERENRALAEKVAALQARLDGTAQPTNTSNANGDGAASEPKQAEAAPAETVVQAPLDQRVDVIERRIDDLSQTKVEASQKFPVRL